ncbi:unnamed protein product [Didymodactylos carnosus]|uniref:Uncharacterized protein n=1 Tax=Didymodactylos carnosus TaxID=1234261 RepID=A0A8S2H6B6_9BILA|nr:unnamed protein product [Didymodactylos carnosus]CAF3599319.1 unnamed protein product [Didymodactylos carnosus]
MSHAPSLNTVNLNDQKSLEEIIHNTIRKHMEISPSRKRKQRQQLIPRHDGECLTSSEAMARLLEKEKAKSQKSEKKKRIIKQKSNTRKKLSGLMNCHFSTPTSTPTSISTDIHCATSTLNDSSAIRTPQRLSLINLSPTKCVYHPPISNSLYPAILYDSPTNYERLSTQNNGLCDRCHYTLVSMKYQCCFMCSQKICHDCGIYGPDYVEAQFKCNNCTLSFLHGLFSY